MSKLYDVISRLEDVASQDEASQDVPIPDISNSEKKSRSPWLKVIVTSLFFILLGLLTIGATAWLQKWFTNQQTSTPPATPTVIATKPVEVVPTTTQETTTPPIEQLPSPAMSGKEIPTVIPKPPATEGTESSDNTITEQFQGTMSVDVATQNITVESLDQFLASDVFDFPEFTDYIESSRTTIFIHDLEIAEPVTEGFTEDFNTTTIQQNKPPAGDIKAKTSKWLHQAELYRHQEEWEGAIILYQRVWDISQNPDVANNLAAALIEVNRVEEAHTILKETFAMTPHDQDIEQNLRIVEQILGR